MFSIYTLLKESVFDMCEFQLCCIVVIGEKHTCSGVYLFLFSSSPAQWMKHIHSHGDWLSKRDFSSSVDFGEPLIRHLINPRGMTAVALGGDELLFFKQSSSWVQHLTMRTGVGFQVLFPNRNSLCTDTKITFYHKRTVIHWVERVLSHSTVCSWNTMPLIRDLTMAL